MTAPASQAQALLALPESERLDALRELVAAEFRTTLLLDADEELPLDRSYFDLGLTSLRLTEIKRRLEQRLSVAISANTMFNEPTIDQLVGHLRADLLGPAEAAEAAEATTSPAPAPSDDRALLDDILKDLYES